MLGVSLLQYRCSKKMDTALLINKSIAAHGGKEKWGNVSTITYIKKTILYQPNGEIEQENRQKISHYFQPNSTQIEWERSDVQYKSIVQNGEIHLFENGIEVFDSLQLSQVRQSSNGALYVFWQPYKLLDIGTKLEYEGQTNLLDSLPVHVLKVTYPEGNQNDIWHYFFDAKTFKLSATQVNHEGRISLIINEVVETKTGMYLNKIRKSYFLDSLEKINYLRAAYDYEIQTLIYR